MKMWMLPTMATTNDFVIMYNMFKCKLCTEDDKRLIEGLHNTTRLERETQIVQHVGVHASVGHQRLVARRVVNKLD